jgi:lipopolysaccharide/colanic/teichoic acid biosynthesis glycosyltransferase/3-dehydroquinate dehydratase
MELVLQAPAISLEQPKRKIATTYTRHLLRIDQSKRTIDVEDAYETMHFSGVTTREAIALLQESDSTVDAVLLSPESVTHEFIELREAARKKAIPIILHTPVFEASAKKTAFSVSADDYHYGTITTAFLKRVDFIKKVKSYKNLRGNKPYVMMTLDQVPQIKLWSMKRAFDILVSATALLLLSPFFLLIALIIKLESKGPVFYISKRAGTGYTIFNFYKFRSMRTGSDADLQKLAHLNQYGKNAGSVFFKIKDDPRITSFGQFIRGTSLDEIPQLLNVLLGDMSLVGNRPLPLYEAEKLTKDQIAWRFLAPAGITGLWQITKRGKDNMSEDERIALDMEYAMKNSFWLDMKILFSTIPALLQKEKV